MENQTKDRLFSAEPRHYIHLGISLVIAIFFRFLPPDGEITAQGMAVLGVFIGVIYGFITVKNNPLVALMGILMMGSTGFYPSPSASYYTAIGSAYVGMLVAIFAMIALMKDSGFLDWLTRSIVGRKIGRKSPWMLLILFIFAHYVVGAFAGWAVTYILWKLWKDVCTQMNWDKKTLRFGIASLMLCCITVGQAWPICVNIITLNGIWTAFSGLDAAPFLNYMGWATIVNWCIIAVWLLLGRFVFKVQMTSVSGFEVEKPGKLTAYQWYSAIALVVYFVVLIIAGLAKGWLTDLVNSFTMVGLAVLIVLIACAIRPTGCKGRIEFFFAEANWGILLTMAMIFLCTKSLSSPDNGIVATLGNALGFMSNMHQTAFLIVMTLLPLLVTQFMSNIATASMFIPVAFTIGSALGVNVYALNIAIYFLASTALGTPAGSGAAGIFFAQEDMDRNTAYKYGWIIAAITWVVVLVIGVLLLGDVFFPRSLAG